MSWFIGDDREGNVAGQSSVIRLGLGFCLWILGSPLSSGILAVNGFRVLSLPVPIILPLFVLGAFPPLPFPRPGVLVGLHSGGGLPLFTGMAVLDSWC